MIRIHLATSTLTTALLSLCLTANSYAATHHAAESKTKAQSAAANSQVTVEGAANTSQEEIATVDVLNEICPAILGTNNTKNFQKGYSGLIAHLLPSIKFPVQSVAAMHSDPEYMKIYNDARTQALAQKPEDNRDVCLDVLHYSDSKKGAGKTAAR